MEQMIKSGVTLDAAQNIAIMLHGRGGDAQGILGLKDQLNLKGFALLALQAENHTWYPFSFMAPDNENEPFLSRSLEKIDHVVNEVLQQGKDLSQIFIIGFSQGACLALEYAARNASIFGGIIAFTGGLIGQNIKKEKYQGAFNDTSIFIGASHQDFHVPLARINDSADLMANMGADIKTLIFKDTLHTIRKKEIDWVNQNILTGF
ncbi:MAG: dienelactone hydrolase family protein [Cyclobacteriaceae bacterium]